MEPSDAGKGAVGKDTLSVEHQSSKSLWSSSLGMSNVIACGVIGLWAKSSQRLEALSSQRPEAPSSAAKGERELEDPATGKASALAFASKASAEASAC